MIALFIVAHGNLGDSLIESVRHVLGVRPPALECLDLTACEDPEQMRALTEAVIDTMDENDGVLLLTDIYGATPCNTVSRMLASSRVEAVAGVNLPMVLKALNYRQLPLHEVALKAIEGGRDGIVDIPQGGNGCA
jgi:PTS system ascorbate-specific IIA component